MKQPSYRMHVAAGVKYLLYLLLVMPLGCLAADTDKALLILSEDAPAYLKVAAEIISAGPAIEIDTVSLDSLRRKAQHPLVPAKLMIPVGSAATEFTLANAPAGSTVLSTFIPHSSYFRLTGIYATQIAQRRLTVSALFLDQPYERQFALARIVKPGFNWLGFVLGPDSKQDLARLQQAAAHQHIQLTYETLGIADNPVRLLQPVIDRSEVFIALPDQTIFNKATAKWLLYMAFRKKIPVIGFSRSYVKAGAIAAIIATPEQVGQHTAEIVIDYYTSGRLSAAQHCRYFTVITNPRAAQQLGISLPEQSTLQQMLMEADNR